MMEAHMISNEFHIDLIKPISNSCEIMILLFLIIQKYYLTLHRKPFTNYNNGKTYKRDTDTHG